MFIHFSISDKQLTHVDFVSVSRMKTLSNPILHRIRIRIMTVLNHMKARDTMQPLQHIWTLLHFVAFLFCIGRRKEFIGVFIIYIIGEYLKSMVIHSHCLNWPDSLNSLFRLRKISEEVTIPLLQARRRSNSLPIPQIEISVYQGTNSNSRDSPSGNTLKDFIEVPDQSTSIIGSFRRCIFLSIGLFLG